MSRAVGRAVRWLPVILVLAVLAAAAVAGLRASPDSTADADAKRDERITEARLDTDGDGIPDVKEVAGWSTQGGQAFVTDPASVDSDGDGLTDGDEVGRLDTIPAAGTFYEGLTDPTAMDSDGDGLDDASEREGGTDPGVVDSDGDGLDDLEEIEFGSDPLSANADGDHLDDAVELAEESDPNTYDLTRLAASAAFAGGAVLGDSEWLAKNVGRLNNAQITSGPYLMGQVIGGFMPLADARDLGANVLNGRWSDALVDLTGVVPLVGDSTKSTALIIGFAGRSGAAARSASSAISKLGPLAVSAKSRLVRLILRIDPAAARLSQDLKVRGSAAPAPLPLGRPIAKDATQNLRKDAIVRDLQVRGYTDIRVNQQQVNAAGERVGVNRPDIQATAPDGTREYWELDTNSSTRGPMHELRIGSNDENAGAVCLLSERTDYEKCDN